MELQNSKANELSVETLDAVAGGRTVMSYVWEGIIQGFQEAGGTVTCHDVIGGGEICQFKP